jgi:hypothetical protein
MDVYPSQWVGASWNRLNHHNRLAMARTVADRAESAPVVADVAAVEVAPEDERESRRFGTKPS